MSSKAKAKEIVINVTKEEFQKDLARGLREDEVLQPGRHTFKRGGFLKRHGIKAKQAALPIKVRISINLDLDVLEYFKQRAEAPNAAPYQTQINRMLREIMEKERRRKGGKISTQAEELLSDQGFIEAVARKIEANSNLVKKRSRRAAQ
ncbi:MAG: BrnA antitoxin family protein [Blastocatellia bacterium]|nr:BrnA antitoxin family protein [Blastocatellia bacterium]